MIPFELYGISFPTKESRLTWRNFCREFSQQFGLICFSEDWRNPVIWSHYANKHRGLALGFEIPKNHLIEVKYRDKRRSFPNLTDTDSSELAPLLLDVLSRKFKHWEYEKELRTFLNLEERDKETGLFFKNFDENLKLVKVVIGSASNLNSARIRSAVPDIRNLEIITARLAFSSFDVVTQKDKRLQR